MQGNRGIILEALLQYEKGEDFADRIIKNSLFKYSHLQKQERSFISRVFLGTIERKLTLDYIINCFSTVKVNKQKPVIRCILRMSVYQMIFMGSVPDAAVINEAVELAKAKKFASLSGFVNGVLRRISREKDSIKYPEIGEKDYLPVKYSCPEWICEHFVEEVGLHKTEAILKNSLKTRPLTVRVNLSKVAKDELIKMLESEGVNVRDLMADDFANVGGVDDSAESLMTDAALVLEDIDVLTELDSFNKGLFTVQDLSSQQVMKDIDLNGVSTVIDVCAAPGGKTCHIADMLLKEGVDARVISRDVSDDKIGKINENIVRCGFDNVKTQVFDALELDESLIGKADIVIADLPCSGLGVIGRKVDIKYRVQPEDLRALAELQRNILSVVSQYVKPGGMLIYSTCTFDKLENEDNVQWIEENLPLTLCKPQTKLLNDNELTDGFFIAKFVKHK